MANIVLVAIATGLELENNGEDPAVNQFVAVTGLLTQIVFTMELVLKVLAEGYEPQRYFTDREDGHFNALDFTVVFLGFVFMGVEGGPAVSALRLLRLVRLLTFVRDIPQLKAILAGLMQGLASVTYIVTLLALIIYLFAITGCLFFGGNDPARFGNIPVAMLSLFQIATLSGWANIAYTSWFGCGHFSDAYVENAAGDDAYDPPSKLKSDFGNFPVRRQRRLPRWRFFELFGFYFS